jgi:hypothetical protein
MEESVKVRLKKVYFEPTLLAFHLNTHYFVNVYAGYVMESKRRKV